MVGYLFWKMKTVTGSLWKLQQYSSHPERCTSTYRFQKRGITTYWIVSTEIKSRWTGYTRSAKLLQWVWMLPVWSCSSNSSNSSIWHTFIGKFDCRFEISLCRWRSKINDVFRGMYLHQGKIALRICDKKQTSHLCKW